MSVQKQNRSDSSSKACVIKMHATDLKLLKALKVTFANGKRDFNTKVELSKGYVINLEEYNKAISLPSGQIDSSKIVLFASDRHLEELSNDQHITERDESVVTGEAIAAYTKLQHAWPSLHDWVYKDAPQYGFDFKFRPEMYSRMLAAGALFSSISRGIERDSNQPIRIKRSDALDVLFPDKEEILHCLTFYTSTDAFGNVKYFCKQSRLAVYWHLDESGAFYRFESRVLEPICTRLYENDIEIAEESKEEYDFDNIDINESAWDEEDIGDER